MPTQRPPTADEAEWYKSQGIDPSEVSLTVPSSEERQPTSIPSTIGSTLKAHAGGIIGGGAGVLGTAALVAPWLLGPEAGIPADAAMLALGVGSGIGSSYVGQKAQDALQGPELTQRLEQEQQKGAEANPKTALATDVIASALASGGRPNLSNIPKAFSGDMGAVSKIAMNSLVNPAINTGIEYATTGQLPSGKELLAQAAGGALFSEQAKWAGKITGHGGIEPAPEANAKEPNQGGVPSSETPDAPSQNVEGPYKMPDLINDSDVTSNYKSLLNKQPKRSDFGTDSQGYIDYSLAKNKWSEKGSISPHEMRDALHQKWLSDLQGSTPVTSTTEEPIVTPPKSNPESPQESVSAKEPTTPVVPVHSEQTENLTAANKDTKPPEPIVPVTTKQATENPNANLLSPRPIKEPYGDTHSISFHVHPDDAPKFTQNSIAKSIPEDIGNNITSVKHYPSDNMPTRVELQFANQQHAQEALDYFKSGKIAPKEILNNQTHELPTSSNKPSEDDNVNQYNQKYEAMKQMISKGQTHTPEFMSTWKELEGIKNKNGGMPPISQSSRQAPNLSEQQKDIQEYKHYQSELQHINTNPNPGRLDIKMKDEVQRMLSGIESKYGGKSPIDVYKAQRGLTKDNSLYTPSNISSDHNPSLKQHISEGKATVGSSLGIIANNEKSPFSPIAKYMLSVGHKDGLATPVIENNKVNSHYNPSYGVQMNPEYYNDYSVTHEAAHALSSKFIDSNPNHPLTKELEYLRQYTEGQIGKSEYGTKDVHEFLAMSLGDKDFQSKLKSIKMEGDSRRTVWDKVVGFVKNILGIPDSHQTMLEKALKTSDSLIKEASGNKGESEGNTHELPPTTTKEKDKEISLNTNRLGAIGRAFEPILDKIRDLKTKSSGELADAAQNAYKQKDELIGATTNQLVRSRKDLKLTPKDSEALWRVADNANKTGVINASGLTKQQKEYLNLNRDIHDTQGQQQLKDQEPVMRNGKPTSLRLDPNHFPTTMEPKIQEVIKKNQDLVEIEKYHKDYLKNADEFGYGKEIAEKKWGMLLDAVRGGINEQGANLQHFNAVRREQGIPLPSSMRRSDFFQNDEAYYNRRATDRAFFNNIEKNPNVWASLGNNKDAWNRPIPNEGKNNIASTEPVRAMLKEWTGDFSGQLSKDEKAVSAAATSGMIASPALEVHKLGSNYVTVAASMAEHPLQMIGQLNHIIRNMTSSIQHAEDNGILKLTNRSLSDFNKSNATFSEKLQALTQGWRQIASVGGLTDRISTGLLQGGFEWGLQNKIQRANNGDVTQQQFMKKLDPSYTVGKSYNEQDINKLASVAAGFAHGTHDARTMPAWMSGDSELSGFFKLAHWSVSQTNRFMSDVYTPATKGDFKPLVMNMFGAAIGGYLIKEIREKMQGKTGQIPSLQDISASEKGLQGNILLVAYNMIAAMQYAGFAGMLSQVARYPFDIAYKNNPQGATFPLDEMGSDVVNTVKNIAGAAANDPLFDWSEAAVKVASHLATQNVAMGRMSYNQLANHGLLTDMQNEKQSTLLKENELRKFQMSNGFPYDEQTQDTANPYMNLEQKKFKGTQDIKEAAGMLPGLISNIIKNYHETPDVMMEKLKSLKGAEYPTMPNPETLPLEFGKYIQYINRRQGLEAAQSAIQDYFRHKAINEAKSSMVP